MFGKAPRTNGVRILCVCILVLGFAVAAGAKPRKKFKKQKETAAQKTARLNREAAVRRAMLLGVSISQANGVNGDLSLNSGRDSSVRTAAANSNRSGAVFVADPEAAAPGLGPNATATAGQLLISEFRTAGRNGVLDEFIEIYNNSGADHTVQATSGTGYGIAASDGATRCTIPNGTVIPNRGHYLCVNSAGFTYDSYPAGNGTTSTGDASYTTDIPTNAGIALFNNNTAGGSYSIANRLDAVGSTAEGNAIYKEGTGYPPLNAAVAATLDSSFYRDNCGKSGSINTFGPCTVDTPKDTDDNASDFVFVDTNGTSAGAGQRLGAPGPENLSSPIQRNASISNAPLDPCASAASPPNRVRDFTSDAPNNSTFGTIDFRLTFTNNTGANITRLRFRIVDQTTFPAPSSFADLRARTSTDVVVTVDRAPCGVGTSNVTVRGTTLEVDNTAPSTGQPNGGGFNSSLSAGIVTLATPLPNGATLDLRFLMGIQQTGAFKLLVNVEALP